MDIDRKVLEVLRENPEATTSEIAARVYDLPASENGRRVEAPPEESDAIKQSIRRLTRL